MLRCGRAALFFVEQPLLRIVAAALSGPSRARFMCSVLVTPGIFGSTVGKFDSWRSKRNDDDSRLVLLTLLSFAVKCCLGIFVGFGEPGFISSVPCPGAVLEGRAGLMTVNEFWLVFA